MQELTDQGVAQLRAAAQQGDPEAQFQLGCHYDFDRPKRKRLAIRWYHKAGAQGHAQAQNYLGESYRDGWGVHQDLREAIRWFRRAAEQGCPSAQLSLAQVQQSRFIFASFAVFLSRFGRHWAP